MAGRPAREADQRRVLIIDDDPKFADIAVRVLRRAGHDCVTMESGGQGLLAVREHRPDAIVLDVMIPPPNGLEVCRQLRAEGWAGGVIMVSALSGPADRAAAAAAGADTFLGKPFPLGALIAAVETLVRPV